MKTKLNHYQFVFLIFCTVSIISCTNQDNIVLYPVSNEAGKYGFIDSTGKIIIDFKFDYVHNFSDNRALVLYNNQPYYIDKKGELLFKASIVYTPWDLSSPEAYDSFLDGTLKELFINVSDEYSFSEGLAAFLDTASKATGYINPDGKVVINPIFSKVNSFHEGLASVILWESAFKGVHKYGYINSNGKFVIEPKFKSVTNFSNSKAFVEIEANEKKTSDGSYVFGSDGYIINKDGQTLSPNLKNVQMWYFSTDGLYLAHNFVANMLSGKGYFYLDSLYNHFPVINNEEIYFSDANHFKDGVASVYVNGKWYIIDKYLKQVSLTTYDDVMTSSEGLIPVKKDNKWKYIDAKGLNPFNLAFDSCSRFKNGLAYVENHNSQSTIKGYINKKGKFVWQNLVANNSVKP